MKQWLREYKSDFEDEPVMIPVADVYDVQWRKPFIIVCGATVPRCIWRLAVSEYEKLKADIAEYEEGIG